MSWVFAIFANKEASYCVSTELGLKSSTVGSSGSTTVDIHGWKRAELTNCGLTGS